jgi:transposase-like protein
MSQGVSMKRRKIDPETKMAAVLEGFKGESSVAEICRKYQISESLYYRWRDKFLEGGSRAQITQGEEDSHLPLHDCGMGKTDGLYSRLV